MSLKRESLEHSKSFCGDTTDGFYINNATVNLGVGTRTGKHLYSETHPIHAMTPTKRNGTMNPHRIRRQRQMFSN